MRQVCGAVPGDRPRDSLAKRRLRAEAEQPLGARDVEAAAGLPVGSGGVPQELALVAGGLGDQRGEVADRDLLAGAEVDRFGAVVAVACRDERFGAVLD